MAVVLTFVTALLSGLVPWGFRSSERWMLLLALSIGLALAMSGAALSVGPYPWTDLVVLLVALSGGLLLGRSMPTRITPFLILLLVLSVLDSIQIVLTSQGATPTAAADAARRGGGASTRLWAWHSS